MTVSVVIPSHSRADLLKECLASVIQHSQTIPSRQSAKPFQSLRLYKPEIIVVDDGSKDACVTRVADAFCVKVIRNDRPQSFARAANRGVAEAKGEIVELLNDDTVVEAGWLEKAIRHFESDHIVAVAPLVLIDSEYDKIDSAGDQYHAAGFARKRFHGLSRNLVHLKPEPVWGANATAGFYRRSAFLKAGGFPDDFGAYFEDVDLAHRLSRLGTTMFEPMSIVRHRISSSYGRLPSDQMLIQQSSNEERVYWRNSATWESIPNHIAMLGGKALLRLCEGKFAPWFRGRFRAICQLSRQSMTRKVTV